MRLTRFTTAAVLALLTACASVVSNLQPPQLDVQAIEVGGGNFEHTQVRLHLHVSNPNDRGVSVGGIDCTLEISGVQVAQCATDAAFVLPPHGETDFTLNVVANMNSVLQVVAANFGQDAVDYRLYGTVHLQSGMLRSIPFNQKGRARLR